MAYDGATGTVVLFGGFGVHGQRFTGTWTWDGSSWSKQHPAARPPARSDAAMAYDPATGTVVLFGGFNGSTFPSIILGDTWTWDGATWTKQVLAVHPSARADTAMAYDAATGTVVLFGGQSAHTSPGDTWIWG